jgi:polysaccharide pyruvyl transferase WcaK-like protein
VTTEKKIHLLCPEYVPLENKGEEAIIRGVVDVLNLEAGCVYHIVDNNSKKYYFKNGIHVHPGALFFSDWRSREFGLGMSIHQLYSSACAILRHLLNIIYPRWISRPHKEARNLGLLLRNVKLAPKRFEKSIDLLKNVDYIIAGHNGGLDEYVCHILREFHTIGIPYGIYGSSMKPNVTNKAIIEVFRKALSGANFVITRNPIGHQWALKHFQDINIEISPDPAFGMNATNNSDTNALISDLGLVNFFSKKVIMFTTAEPAPIIRHAFNQFSSSAKKIEAHREYFAKVVNHIHKKYDVNLLFLPHTIGPSAGMDDREISKDIINRAGLEKDDRVFCLESDLSAMELKGIINLAEMLVAERVHSVIGAIGVCTPFLLLSSKADTRGLGIIDRQMGLGKYIKYLNEPSLVEVTTAIDEIILERQIVQNELETVNITIREELDKVANQIRQKITSS